MYCGQTDVSLSQQGMQELLALKNSIVYPTADVYITSGLKRTAETLQVLYDKDPDIVISEFKELNFGDFEMKSYEELKNRPEYQQWIGGAHDFACPNGESKAEFNGRVRIGLEKLCGIKADSAVVICHGGVIVHIMERMFPKQRNFYEWQPENGRGYSLEIKAEKTILISEI